MNIVLIAIWCLTFSQGAPANNRTSSSSVQLRATRQADGSNLLRKWNRFTEGEKCDIVI